MMKRVARTPVLVCVDSDGFLTVHGPRTLDVHIQRVVKATYRLSEQLAEDASILLMPERFRKWYGQQRASEMIRPLMPSTAAHAIYTKDVIDALNNQSQAGAVNYG